jgi:hypothetical protein
MSSPSDTSLHIKQPIQLTLVAQTVATTGWLGKIMRRSNQQRRVSLRFRTVTLHQPCHETCTPRGFQPAL